MTPTGPPLVRSIASAVPLDAASLCWATDHCLISAIATADKIASQLAASAHDGSTRHRVPPQLVVSTMIPHGTLTQPCYSLASDFVSKGIPTSPHAASTAAASSTPSTGELSAGRAPRWKPTQHPPTSIRPTLSLALTETVTATSALVVNGVLTCHAQLPGVPEVTVFFPANSGANFVMGPQVVGGDRDRDRGVRADRDRRSGGSHVQRPAAAGRLVRNRLTFSPPPHPCVPLCYTVPLPASAVPITGTLETQHRATDRQTRLGITLSLSPSLPTKGWDFLKVRVALRSDVLLGNSSVSASSAVRLVAAGEAESSGSRAGRGADVPDDGAASWQGQAYLLWTLSDACFSDRCRSAALGVTLHHPLPREAPAPPASASVFFSLAGFTLSSLALDAPGGIVIQPPIDGTHLVVKRKLVAHEYRIWGNEAGPQEGQ